MQQLLMRIENWCHVGCVGDTNTVAALQDVGSDNHRELMRSNEPRLQPNLLARFMIYYLHRAAIYHSAPDHHPIVIIGGGGATVHLDFATHLFFFGSQ